MGEATGIAWTHHTFNAWLGCTRVSPACEHCYAETFAKRLGVEWGVKAERRPIAEATWKNPQRWNRKAEKEGKRHRVFCSSLADVFEDRDDLNPHRERLFKLIVETPWLDWQLLTKRPECVMRMVPESWRTRFPDNVWIGTTVEDQRRANERIPHLVDIPAKVHFLSCEPLLGEIDFRAVPGFNRVNQDLTGWWIIVGGESGHGARPMHPKWARDILRQCASAGVPFFFKQWGEWAPRTIGIGSFNSNDPHGIDRLVSVGGMPYCFQEYAGDGAVPMSRVGKHAAGDILDGVRYQEFPRGIV